MTDNRNRTRTISAILAAPILSAAVLTAAVSAATPAVAQPTTGTACASMAMPSTQAAAGSPNSMTRAGQIAAANSPAPSVDAPMDCNAQSHG